MPVSFPTTYELITSAADFVTAFRRHVDSVYERYADCGLLADAPDSGKLDDAWAAKMIIGMGMDAGDWSAEADDLLERLDVAIPADCRVAWHPIRARLLDWSVRGFGLLAWKRDGRGQVWRPAPLKRRRRWRARGNAIRNELASFASMLEAITCNQHPQAACEPPAMQNQRRILHKDELTILRALASSAFAMTQAEIHQATVASGERIPLRTIQRRLKDLRESCLVDKISAKGGWSASSAATALLPA